MELKSHCHFCGNRLASKFVEGRQRRYCGVCERPIYENPIPATCLVVVDAQSRLLLVKRDVSPKKGQWCLPGGFIELGEAPEKGALRELTEETGLSGHRPVLMGVRTTPSSQYHSVLMVGYLVKSFQGKLIAGDDAADALWFLRKDLPPVAFESHRYFIDLFWSDHHLS